MESLTQKAHRILPSISPIANLNLMESALVFKDTEEGPMLEVVIPVFEDENDIVPQSMIMCMAVARLIENDPEMIAELMEKLANA